MRQTSIKKSSGQCPSSAGLIKTEKQIVGSKVSRPATSHELVFDHNISAK